MKVVVARLFHLLRDLAVGLLPGDVFPIGGSRPSHLRLEQPAIIQDVLLERRAFRAQRSAIDGMIGIALDVHHLRDRVLGLVAERVDDHAAAHRTIGTSAAGLAGARNFQVLGLRVDRSEIKSKGGNAGSSEDGALEKSSAGEIHTNLSNLAHTFSRLETEDQSKVDRRLKSGPPRYLSHDDQPVSRLMPENISLRH